MIREPDAIYNLKWNVHIRIFRYQIASSLSYNESGAYKNDFSTVLKIKYKTNILIAQKFPFRHVLDQWKFSKEGILSLKLDLVK